MKFLVYTPVSEEVSDYCARLARDAGSLVSKIEYPLHSTLLVLDTDENQEQAIVQGLVHVRARPLRYCVSGFQLFGSAFVLRCQMTSEILSTHEAVCDAVRHVPRKILSWGDTEEDHARARKYGSHFFGELFKPHVTVAYVGEGLVLPERVEQLQWACDRFILAKKKDSAWQTVHEYMIHE